MTIHIPTWLLAALLLLVLSPIPALLWLFVLAVIAIATGIPPVPEGTDPNVMRLIVFGVFGMFAGGTLWGWLTAGAVRAETWREAQP